MTKIVVIAFRAIAWDKNGHQYDANFLFHFPENKVTADEVNRQIQIEINRFREWHPNGQIIQQFQRVGHMRNE